MAITIMPFRGPSACIRRPGFTLIELLVVIAILCLLAAILFPAFARARENGRRAACLSNMKQMGIGMQQYVHDYDDAFPPYRRTGADQYLTVANGTAVGSCSTTAATCVKVSWPDLIFPYVKSAGVFNDPSNTNTYFSGCIFADGLTTCGDPTTSFPNGPKPWTYVGPLSSSLAKDGTVRSGRDGMMYGYDQYIGGNSGTHRLSEFTFAGEKMLLVEGTRYNIDYPTQAGCGALVARHFNGVNTAFVDGHVKWINWSAICQNQANSEDTKHLWFIDGETA